MPESEVPHGAVVRIMTTDGFYLAQNPSGTYCAAATKDKGKSATFQITYDFNRDSAVVNAYNKKWIRIRYNDGHNYLGDCRYLYNATTGSAKYDYDDAKNSKQFWKLSYEGSIDLRYGTEVSFLDLYVDSYLCVNTTAYILDLSGGGKVWVEGKYPRHMLENFRSKFIVERA